MAEELNPDEIAQLITQIYSQSTWASEATAEGIYRRQSSIYTNLAQKSNKIREAAGLDLLSENLDEVIASYHEQGKKLTAAMQHDTAGDIMSMQRANDPIEGLMEGVKAMGGVFGNISDALTGAGWKDKDIGSFKKSVSGVLDTSGKFLLGTSALGSAAGAYLMSQEKQLRTMIEFGLIATDINDMTQLRGLAAEVGQSMAELSPILDNHKAMLANVGGDSLKGASDFLKFNAQVESGRLGITDMGYSTKELTARLAEEADMLYGFGEVRTLDDRAKAQIAARFTESSVMTTFLAGKTGMTRKEMLKLREAAQKDVDFQEAFRRNGEIITERFGANAKDNVLQAQGEISYLAELVMGPEMRDMMLQNFTGTLADLHLDTDPVNNANRELVERLNMLGPGIAQHYFKIMEGTTSGQLVGQDLVMEMQKFNKSIAGAKLFDSGHPAARAVNTMIMQARQAGKTGFMDMTEQELKVGMAKVPEATEIADQSVDVVDSFAKGMKQTEHKILPGFEGMSFAFEKINTGLSLMGKGMNALIGGSANKDELTERTKEQFKVYEDLYNDRKEALAPFEKDLNALANQKSMALEKMKSITDPDKKKDIQNEIKKIDSEMAEVKGNIADTRSKYDPKVREAKAELDKAKEEVYKDQNVRGDLYKIEDQGAKHGKEILTIKDSDGEKIVKQTVAQQYDRGWGYDWFGGAPFSWEVTDAGQADIDRANKAGGEETDTVTAETVTARRNAEIVDIETGSNYNGNNLPDIPNVVTPTSEPDDTGEWDFDPIQTLSEWWNSFWNSDDTELPETEKKPTPEPEAKPKVSQQPEGTKVSIPIPDKIVKSVNIQSGGFVTRYQGFKNELEAALWRYETLKDGPMNSSSLAKRKWKDSVKRAEQAIKRYGGPDLAAQRRAKAKAEFEAKKAKMSPEELKELEKRRKKIGAFALGGNIEAMMAGIVGDGGGPEMFIPRSFELGEVQSGVGSYLDNLANGEPTSNSKIEIYSALAQLEEEMAYLISDINESQRRTNQRESVNYGR